jgi:hypothetical protein
MRARRDAEGTHGRALSDAERHTYFPASLLVSLLCWRSSEVKWLSEPGFVPPPGFNMTTTVLSGPFTLPSDWSAWANALQAEGDDRTRLALVEPFLPRCWQAIAPQRTAGRSQFGLSVHLPTPTTVHREHLPSDVGCIEGEVHHGASQLLERPEPTKRN